MALFFAILLDIIAFFLLQSALFPLPVSDTGSVRYRSFPWMTMTLIIVNSLVFIAWTAPKLYAPDLAGSFSSERDALLAYYPYIEQTWTYGLRSSFLRDGQSIGAFTSFTSMFMHADMYHLIGNMIYLWAFGRRLEDACGPWRYLAFYLAAGMIANIGSAIINPGDVPGIGASGAISGVMGAYLILFPGARIQSLWLGWSIIRIPFAAVRGQPLLRWVFSVPAWFILGEFVINQIVSVSNVLQGGNLSGVNNTAHLLGFLGAIIIFLFVRKDLLVRYAEGRAL
jgi:membrane associated rhomboid family serine protease